MKRTHRNIDQRFILDIQKLFTEIMVFSFIHPATCGFARGVAWEISKQIDDDWKFGDADTRAKLKQSCLITERFNRFTAVFGCCKENYAVDLKLFGKILPDLRTKFAKWNSRRIHERNQYTATFNTKSWKKLPETSQVQHTFQNCRARKDRFAEVQALFPVKSAQFLRRTTPECSSPLTNSVDSCTNNLETLSKGCTKRQAVEAARTIYNRINPSFESTRNVPLSAALINVQELNVEEKKSKNEKREERRRMYKKSKQAIEAEWAKTDLVR